MEHSIDLNKVRVRKDRVEGIVYSHLKEKYTDIIVKVECKTFSYSWKGVSEFDFIIDVDYGGVDWANSFCNRKIKKEVSNLCKYILGEHESFGSVSFNSVIHAFPHPLEYLSLCGWR